MALFDGKVALVTGAGTGIGRAVALAMAREGANVVVGNRNEARGQAVVAEIEKAGARASFRQTDVRIESDVAALVEHAYSTFGRLDVLNNNAGILGAIAPLTDQISESFDDVMATNVKGVWLGMKYAIARMKRHGGGVIVNTASIAGVIGSALGLSCYIASKHAVIGLTRSAALEFATDGIRVNAVAPAIIDTAMPRQIADSLGVENDFSGAHPIGRSGTPEEVAEAVVWLSSDKAAFVTGHTLMVDGGLTAQ